MHGPISIIVLRPPSEVYAFWRDPWRLARETIMRAHEGIQQLSRRLWGHRSVRRPLMTTLRSLTLIALTMGHAGSRPADALRVASVGMVPDAWSQRQGSVSRGREVFRFETFGNEGFWTDAARVPQGMREARVTPLMAMQLGLSVDVEAVDAATKRALVEQLRNDSTGRTSALLNDPAITIKLVNANAVIGLVVKPNAAGVRDVTQGAKVGVTCALCHTITDGSVLSLPNGGSVGRREDGRTNHHLDVGAVLATAANSRAMYPVLQLALKANGGKTHGRARDGLTSSSTEAEVDAYLKNKDVYPVGMFDDTFDGNGNPMQITPFFRQDLAAPFGSGGEIAELENFNNLVYTSLFDLTQLTTPGGRALLRKLGGAAGDEIADEYVKVLAATGVTGYPFVKAAAHPKAGSEAAPTGRRVDEGKLRDLNAFLVALPAPRGVEARGQGEADGQQLFTSAGCAACHTVDQGRPVRDTVIVMKRIFPGDNPAILAARTPPLNPIMDTPGNTFDDKMAVVNASMRGGPRGIALPLLLDLARKPVFLHDKSVPGLDRLLDPARGENAPHAFYITEPRGRAAVVEFLRSLDTRGHRGAP